MNSEDQFLSKSSIDYRFGLSISVLINDNIANSKSEIADVMGVKPAKFSEILNGRMHVGVDMLAILSQYYHVDPDWLLTGRGESMFRKTSILPPRLDESEIKEDHPYTFEDEKEVMDQMFKEYDEREKQKTEKHTTPILLDLIQQKETKLLEQAEEIGKLKERIAQLEKEKNNSKPLYHPSRKELSTSEVDS